MTLRRATLEDSRFAFEVANEPTVRSQSFATDPIPWETHEPWFEQKLAQPTSRIYIVALNNIKAGVIRFDLKPEGWVVGIGLAKESQGKGLGSSSLAEACQIFQKEHVDSEVHAYIKTRNEHSKRLFRKVGFEFVEVLIVAETPAEHLVLPSRAPRADAPNL